MIVFEAAPEVGVADTDPDADTGLDPDPDPDPEADGDEDPEFVAEGESVLDCPIDPRTLLRLLDATTVVGCAELAALDMSLPGIDRCTTLMSVGFVDEELDRCLNEGRL